MSKLFYGCDTEDLILWLLNCKLSLTVCKLWLSFLLSCDSLLWFGSEWLSNVPPADLNCLAVCLKETVSDSEVDAAFRGLFAKLAGDVRFLLCSYICSSSLHVFHSPWPCDLLSLVFQDMEISATELRTIMNKIVSKSKSTYFTPQPFNHPTVQKHLNSYLRCFQQEPTSRPTASAWRPAGSWLT